MATVGYLQGVDPLLLTWLAVRGVGTLPISNGFDNHGKFINAITERDGVTLVLGHLHKVLRTQRQGFLAEDILESCFACKVPILIIVQGEDHAAARERLAGAAERVVLVAPEDVRAEVVSRLGL
jgi:hypothetical protein